MVSCQGSAAHGASLVIAGVSCATPFAAPVTFRARRQCDSIAAPLVHRVARSRTGGSVMATAQPWSIRARTGWVQLLAQWTRQLAPLSFALSQEQESRAEEVLPLPAHAPARAFSAHPDDFEAFFQQHEHAVFGYLLRMTGDEQTAHDLSQEAFLRAWQHFDKIRGYDHPAAWLFRVASNLAISHLRRRSSPVGSAKLLGDDDSPARSDPAMRFI